MEAYLFDWANLLLRWLHVIVAIAWIGSSFYFVWLDNHLTAPVSPELRDKGVGGELWALHGGGFYNPQKYLGAPPKLPEHLHWFYWESYSTWLSGFSLFLLVYIFNARTYLIDPQVANLSPSIAIIAALGFLAIGWLIYDGLCRLFGKQERLLSVLVVALVIAAAWTACHLFSGRAAFLIIGAMIATIMSANVFFWIIPGQRKMVASMQANQPVDPIHGQRGKQRSVHNTYFTLPVLFAMLSNHYSMTYSSEHNWLVLVLIMIAGVLIRQFFVLRHKGQINFAYPAIAIAVLVGVIAWIAPASSPVVAAAPAQTQNTVGIAEVQHIVESRCIQCHAAKPSMMPSAAKGIMLDSADNIRSHAQQIYQQAVVQKNMPLGNVTNITDAERASIAQWFEAGAK
jgi:uncharacterized membrane protein